HRVRHVWLFRGHESGHNCLLRGDSAAIRHVPRPRRPLSNRNGVSGQSPRSRFLQGVLPGRGGEPGPARSLGKLAPGANAAMRESRPAADRRVVTILSADVSGFTRLAERRDPEETMELVDECFRAIREEIVQCGGWIEKYIGDEVLAIFGA